MQKRKRDGGKNDKNKIIRMLFNSSFKELSMVKKEPISVNWQSLFVIIPFVDLWAAYRIEKLRWFFIMIWIPSLVETFFVRPMIYLGYFEKYFENSTCESNWSSNLLFNICDPIEMQVHDIVLMVLFVGAAVFLIRKWSKEWNEKISTNS